MPFRVTEDYIHLPIREADEFQESSFRTDDIGKKGFSKRVAGKLRSTGKWATQKYLVSTDESPQMKRSFVKRAIDELRRLGRSPQIEKLRMKVRSGELM